MRIRTFVISGLSALVLAAPAAYAATATATSRQSTASANTVLHRWSIETLRALAGAGYWSAPFS